MENEQREAFIREAIRLDELENVEKNFSRMSEDEIISRLINAGFTEAAAWEKAKKLKSAAEN